ncbi:hypothetical protein ABZ656_35075 [Streptomyces sp. NPDC007095]|uniref:hypothetical protein n=1 Tax=Streptomyces sp. NPDC007095 TaxID=3154482 RepID=UPI0033D9ABA4
MHSTVLQSDFSASSRSFPAGWSRPGPDTGLRRRDIREPSSSRCGISMTYGRPPLTTPLR